VWIREGGEVLCIASPLREREGGGGGGGGRG